MNKNIEKSFKEALQDLQQEVLDLHRKAGALDLILEQIGIDGDMNNDPRYLEMYVKAQMNYYQDLMKARGYNTLQEKEKQVVILLICHLVQRTLHYCAK